MKRYLLPLNFFFLPLWAFAHNGVDDGDEISTSTWLHPPPAPDAIYQVHPVQTTSHTLVYTSVLLLIVLLIIAVIFWKKRN